MKLKHESVLNELFASRSLLRSENVSSVSRDMLGRRTDAWQSATGTPSRAHKNAREALNFNKETFLNWLRNTVRVDGRRTSLHQLEFHYKKLLAGAVGAEGQARSANEKESIKETKLQRNESK